MMAAALGLSLVAFWQLLALPSAERAFDVTVAQWIPTIPLQLGNGAMGGFQVPWGFRLDPLSAMMLLVVTGIGTLIHVYSTAYMADEPRGGVARFFCYLNLFCFFMLMLVLGNNFLVMFVGWEGVGLCSYLLIGYWYEKKSASDAGKKAFITNRVGDWGFVLGVFLIYSTFGTLDFRAVQNAAATMPVETAHFGVLSFICLFLFVGATGQERADSALRLAAGRDGRPDAGLRADSRGDHGDGRRLHGRPQRGALFARAPGDGDHRRRRRADGADGGLDRPRPVRHQARARLLDRLAARLHVHGDGRRRVFGRGVPSDDARVLQGAAVPRQRLGDPRDGRRAGHAPHGRPQEIPAGHLLRRCSIGTLAIAGILPFAGFFSKDEILFRAFRAQPRHLGARRRDRADDGVLHVPPDGDDVPWRVPWSRVGTGGPRRPPIAGQGVAAGRAGGGGPRRGAPGRSARARSCGRARSRSGARTG